MTLASNNNNNTSRDGELGSLDVVARQDEEHEDEMNSENDGNTDENLGSDTSRVVKSAVSYARDCLRTENYTEATTALRSVLEISKPSSASYKLTVLNVAQVLKAAQQLNASIDCMLVFAVHLPVDAFPFFTDGRNLCHQHRSLYPSQARLYEQLESTNTARFWWRKLDDSAKLNFEFWEAMADRFFEDELCVFAADFYGQAWMLLAPEKNFLLSNRFRYRYLLALSGFVQPQGPTRHKNFCSEVAWSMAQSFRRQNGNHISACYGDAYFYQMCTVYSTTFPAIYRVVFAWIDGPAGRIARWWRRQWASLHPPPKDISSSSSQAKSKRKKKLGRRTAPCAIDEESPIQVHPFLRRKVFTSRMAQSPSRARKPRNKKDDATSQHGTSVESSTWKEACKLDLEQPTREIPGLSNNASSNDDQHTAKLFSEAKEIKAQSTMKKFTRRCEGSSQKSSILRRHQRKRSSGELTCDQVSSLIDTEDDSSRSSSTSLLDMYPLQIPRIENFVAICGREPGFADLNLDEVGEFARLAHYRAKVLAGEHARVDNLDPTSVKPQWLQDVDKVIALVETHQQRNLASGKVVADGDSIAHLSEVHTRLVLLTTTLCRQYTRDFGETSFTRRLRALSRRLFEWKFTRISEVIAALQDSKSVATREEKQRNLEFYHVHRGDSGSNS